ncbi:MAG: hypothetical protein SGILL_006800 [Bacillariaceae sp.]
MTEADSNTDHLKERLDIVKWLQDEELNNPLGSMANVYLSPDTGKESLPFTNVTSGFVGHLDYIMYPTESMKVNDLLYVPRNDGDLNDLDIPNGHLLPSCFWPSDHLAIGCSLRLQDHPLEKDATIVEAKTQEADDMWCGLIASAPPPPPIIAKKHTSNCSCGCVPAIPGLFEMAERRKQARLQKQLTNS